MLGNRTISQKMNILFILLFLVSIFLLFYLAWLKAGDGRISAEAMNSSKFIDYVPGEIIVKYKYKPADKNRQRLYAKIKAKKSTFLPKSYIEKFEIQEEEDIDKTISEIRAEPYVDKAEPNYKFYKTSTPNDTYYSDQWAFTKINGPSAWDITTGNASTIIAVVDTGVNYNHPDLAAKVIKGYNFVDNNNDPLDDEGHGTNVAGAAAATTNNSQGIAGVSWNSKILAVKSLDSDGIGTTFTIYRGIEYAYLNGANVINLSFGSTFKSDLIQAEINTAHKDYGCVIVASSGNQFIDPDNPAYNIIPPTTVYPAALDNVIAVGSTTSSDIRKSDSNYGNFLDISAPGDNILVTHINNGYVYTDGASIAAPFISGQAALLFSHPSNLSNLQVENFLLGGVKDLGIGGWDNIYGSGRLDMKKSLTMANKYQHLYAPHIGKSFFGWTTPLVVQNISTGPGSVFNTFVGSESKIVNGYGADYENGQSASFNPQHINQVSTSFRGSAFITSDVDVAGIINEHSASSSMAYEAISDGSDKVYLPNINKQYYQWTTPIIIQNLETTTNVSVQVSFYDPDTSIARFQTSPIDISPASSYYLNPNWLSDAQIPLDWKGSAKVEETGGKKIMAIVNEQTSEQAMAYNGFTEGSKDFYLPNITRKYYGWSTPFIVQNISTNYATVTASFYRRGSPSPVLTLTKSGLAPSSSWGVNPLNYSSLGTFQGSVVIESTEEVVAVVNEHSSKDSMAYSGISSSKNDVFLPNITKSYAGWTTPFIIQNMSDSQATTNISYYKSDGSLQKKRIGLALNPGGSIFINPASDKGIPSGFKGSVVVNASQPVASIVNEHESKGQAMSYNGTPKKN